MKTKSCEGKRNNRGGGTTAVTTTTVRGALWPMRLRRFSNVAFCASFLFADFTLDLPSWAYWASFTTSLDLVWPQFHAFPSVLGSTHANPQSKPEQAKTERNRRNMCVNRKIMQINPKIEFKSIKIPVHIRHLSNSTMLKLLSSSKILYKTD